VQLSEAERTCVGGRVSYISGAALATQPPDKLDYVIAFVASCKAGCAYVLVHSRHAHTVGADF